MRSVIDRAAIRSGRKLLFGLLGSQIAAFMLLGAVIAPTASADLPVETRFILSTHTGQVVTDQDFRGRLRLMFFGYTHCPDVCPASLQTVSEVIDLLGSTGRNLTALFVSLDPERDTPKVLAGYLRNFHASIIGLTGPKEMIEHISRAYRVKSERVYSSEGDKTFYAIDHTASLLLLDGDGKIARRFVPGASPHDIAATIQDLMNSKGRHSTD